VQGTQHAAVMALDRLVNRHRFQFLIVSSALLLWLTALHFAFGIRPTIRA
jgi:hypothetical protein